jgi:MFS family permease
MRRILRGSRACRLKTGSCPSTTVLPGHSQGHSAGRKIEYVRCVFYFGNHRTGRSGGTWPIGSCPRPVCSLLRRLSQGPLPFTVVYGVLFAFGLSGAGIIPNTNLVARWFVRQRGRAMGLVTAGGFVGQLLLNPASMALLLWPDWRTTDLILGIIIASGSVSYAIQVRRYSLKYLAAAKA